MLSIYLQMMRQSFEKLETEYSPQVPEVDPRGNVVPSWKRQLLAKQIAEKTEKEEQQKKKRQEEEAR